MLVCLVWCLCDSELSCAHVAQWEDVLHREKNGLMHA